MIELNNIELAVGNVSSNNGKGGGVRGILNPNIVAPRQVDCKESAAPLAGIDFGYSKQIVKFFARHFGMNSYPQRYTARVFWCYGCFAHKTALPKP
jgi:hypothetical protein